MDHSLERKIRTAEQLARACDMNAALGVADEVVVEAPGEARAWGLRAFVLELEERHVEARDDLSRAIALAGQDSHLYYARGRMSYLAGAPGEALLDFSHALRLIDEQGVDDDRQELYFWRAAARVGLGEFRSALDDLGHVNDGFCTWTNGLITKADLLAECG